MIGYPLSPPIPSPRSGLLLLAQMERGELRPEEALKKVKAGPGAPCSLISGYGSKLGTSIIGW